MQTPLTPQTTTRAVDLQRIGQIAIVVRDPERALTFYRDTLGLKLLFQAPPNLAFFECGGIRLMLSPPEGSGTEAASSILYYSISDIRATYEALLSRGVEFEQPPHIVAALPDRDVWMAFFRDSEANLLALMAEVPRAS
jgi:methylmalonyl-CoA/ethylmalonyl-CoA epimerase